MGQKLTRSFLPEKLDLDNFKIIQPYLEQLLEDDISKSEDLKKWLSEHSELEAFLSEDMAWRYINYTRYTDNKEYLDKYTYFIEEIQPELVKADQKLNKKLISSKAFDALPDFPFKNFKAKTHLNIDLFREENIELEVKQSNLSQKYSAIVGGMTITHDGKELTLQQAGKLLQSNDRDLRKNIYEKVNSLRLEHSSEINDIFDELVSLRNQESINAGFENYRDYKHKALGRLDYSVEDVKIFHQSVEEIAVPYKNHLQKERKSELGLERLKPFDLSVDIRGDEALKPFETGDELRDKAIACFDKIDPMFGDVLKQMKDLGFLDLTSRKGKAPGGYNYPLDEHGYPFIFMNASGSMRDVTTMVHEGGHAVHTVLSRNIELNSLKHFPSEVAELASMSMELISMEAWDVFFADEKDLLRAKIEQLEGVLDVLPWIAVIDKFQHWIYTHPNHSREERAENWVKIYKTYNQGIVDYQDYEEFRSNLWQKQLHIFEVPFYYLEYGIAQLGSIAVWKNYKENRSKAIDQYKAALSLGYTKSIGEIYETAGVKFDFSKSYMQELLSFVHDELSSLKKEFQAL